MPYTYTFACTCSLPRRPLMRHTSNDSHTQPVSAAHEPSTACWLSLSVPVGSVVSHDVELFDAQASLDPGFDVDEDEDVADADVVFASGTPTTTSRGAGATLLLILDWSLLGSIFIL